MVYIIAGNGPAGISAIETIRGIDPDGRIILVSDESNPPYSRIMIPELMTGEVEEEDIFIRKDTFYQEFRVETRLGLKIDKIRPELHQVILNNGETLRYDQLLIATGSSPVIPRALQTNLKGVFSLWTKKDSERIREYLPRVQKAVIVGGGLVGLQAARSLHEYGVNVTVVEMADRLMSAQLDETASRMLEQAMEDQGIKVLLNTEVQAIQGVNEVVTAVDLAEKSVPADLVLISVGVRPNLKFLHGVEIRKDYGLFTDSFMQTSIPDIYAAGDVAQAKSAQTGDHVPRALWLTAVQQGKIAGANMAGGKIEYSGSYAMNSIQLFGLSIVSCGELTGEGKQFVWKESQTKSYQKILVWDGCLEGLLFVGNVQKAGILYHKLGKPLGQGYWGSFRTLNVEYTA